MSIKRLRCNPGPDGELHQAGQVVDAELEHEAAAVACLARLYTSSRAHWNRTTARFRPRVGIGLGATQDTLRPKRRVA